MAKKTDQKTLDLIKEVAKQKAEISKAERPNWKTNCAFTYIEGNLNGATNLHVQSNVKELISIAGFLLEKAEAYGKAASALGLNSPPSFTWSGFSVDDWLEDIRTRINKLQIASKKEKLEKLEFRLNAIISPELRAEMELAAIQSDLS